MRGALGSSAVRGALSVAACGVQAEAPASGLRAPPPQQVLMGTCHSRRRPGTAAMLPAQVCTPKQARVEELRRQLAEAQAEAELEVHSAGSDVVQAGSPPGEVLSPTSPADDGALSHFSLSLSGPGEPPGKRRCTTLRAAEASGVHGELELVPEAPSRRPMGERVRREGAKRQRTQCAISAPA